MEKRHLDAIEWLNSVHTSDSGVDKELEEKLREFYQSNNNITVRNVNYSIVKNSERFT